VSQHQDRYVTLCWVSWQVSCFQTTFGQNRDPGIRNCRSLRRVLLCPWQCCIFRRNFKGSFYRTVRLLEALPRCFVSSRSGHLVTSFCMLFSVVTWCPACCHLTKSPSLPQTVAECRNGGRWMRSVGAGRQFRPRVFLPEATNRLYYSR
jgi:hypothetical protein